MGNKKRYKGTRQSKKETHQRRKAWKRYIMQKNGRKQGEQQQNPSTCAAGTVAVFDGNGDKKTEYQAYVEGLRQGRSEAGPSCWLPSDPVQAGTTRSDEGPEPLEDPEEKPSQLPEAPDTGTRQSGRIYHQQELTQKMQIEQEERKLAKYKEKMEIKRLQEAEKKAAKKKLQEQNDMRRQSERIKREQAKEKRMKGELFMMFVSGMSEEYMALPPKRQRVFRVTAVMLLNEMLDEQEMEERLASFVDSTTT